MSITLSTFLASGAVDAHREGITGDQLKVDVADILSYNAELANYVLDNPTESLPLVNSPLLDILHTAISFGVYLILQMNAAQPPVCGSLGSWQSLCVHARSWRRWRMRCGRSRCTTRRLTMRRRSCRSCRCCCTAAGASGPSPSGNSRYRHQIHFL